jgi:hypothetical protein
LAIKGFVILYVSIFYFAANGSVKASDSCVSRCILDRWLAAMDDGDLDFSNPETYLCPAIGNDPSSSCPMDSYFDEILKDAERHACTHTHTCNPPVDDQSHTHTCVHVHTKILPASPEGAETSELPPGNSTSKKRPSGNRAAVRRYREKKKARTASLEEEVAQLRALNQQFVKKLQNHAALEAEAARLRCLLVDVRGRIEGEIGAFPYHRPFKSMDPVANADQGRLLGGAQVAGPCDFRCNDQVYCNPGMQVGTVGENAHCLSSAKSGSTKVPVCVGMDTLSSGCLLDVEKR